MGVDDLTGDFGSGIPDGLSGTHDSSHGGHDSSGTDDLFAHPFDAHDTLDPNADPATGWDPLFSSHGDAFSARLREDWTHAGALEPSEVSWHALLNDVPGSSNGAPLFADPLMEPNAHHDPFADPLLSPLSPLDEIFPSHDSGVIGDYSSSHHAGAFHLDSELARLAGLDHPGTAADTHADSETSHSVTPPPTEPADQATGTDINHAHVGGAAAATVGLVGAGFAASRPAPPSAPGGTGTGNADDLDPPDDDDEDNFVFYEEFHTDHDAVLLAGGLDRVSEAARRLRLTDVAWQDIANAAAALGARRGTDEGPDAAAAFLARVRQTLDLLLRHPETGFPLPTDSDAGPHSTELADARVFVLSGAFPCDLYYRLLPDPDGPEGPETEALLILRLLPATLGDAG